ncbi:hypothetical protein [Mycolicibacter sinensis]|uniref:DUF559 domain-containing protein n=1 Tax=Mycolicibacter sinensis (strain JDM601) TaxID=875328 RepID=A0A1A2EQR0_MYCSD|nr:hypothetical protein [Mycolicibacter sinensis]OBG04228.1 hypothetical protein A5772_05540 [Mycolicibacter sinensis]OBG07166.1 hypothetical protein A5771_07260 [Mycolicibacter sinensis]
MGRSGNQPFIGSEALRAGTVTWYELAKHYRAIMPDVYLDRRAARTMRNRTLAAWLWSRRRAVVAGAAASALHGAKWIDDDTPVELIWRNARAPQGVIARSDLLLGGETQRWGALEFTTPERTAFDLGRRGSLWHCVARLDALACATGFKLDDVMQLAKQHPHTKGLRQLETALDLVDSGSGSPRETKLRLLLIKAGFPRPQTQIPVLRPNGRWFFLDMGWEDIKLTLEYDGDQHRTSRPQFVKDAERLEYILRMGWTHIKVLAEHRDDDVIYRVRQAWNHLTAH